MSWQRHAQQQSHSKRCDLAGNAEAMTSAAAPASTLVQHRALAPPPLSYVHAPLGQPTKNVSRHLPPAFWRHHALMSVSAIQLLLQASQQRQPPTAAPAGAPAKRGAPGPPPPMPAGGRGSLIKDVPKQAAAPAAPRHERPVLGAQQGAPHPCPRPRLRSCLRCYGQFVLSEEHMPMRQGRWQACWSALSGQLRLRHLSSSQGIPVVGHCWGSSRRGSLCGSSAKMCVCEAAGRLSDKRPEEGHPMT